MTTIQATAPGQVAVRNPQGDATRRGGRRSAPPLLAVALAAAVGGGVVGGAAAVAVPTLTRDAAAEQARWREFGLQLERAIRLDDFWQQLHPEWR